MTESTAPVMGAASRKHSACELPVPGFRQHTRWLGPGRVEPPVERGIALHPQMRRGSEVLDASAEVNREAESVLAPPGSGRHLRARQLDRYLLGVRPVAVGDTPVSYTHLTLPTIYSV